MVKPDHTPDVELKQSEPVEVGTSKIGVFSSHVEANQPDIDAVVETLESAGFGVERHEPEDSPTELRGDPYFVVHLPEAE